MMAEKQQVEKNESGGSEKPIIQLTRDDWRKLRKLSRAEMQERLNAVYKDASMRGYARGYSNGYDHAAKVCDNALREGYKRAVIQAIEETQGIGPVLEGRIKEKLSEASVDIKNEVEKGRSSKRPQSDSELTQE